MMESFSSCPDFERILNMPFFLYISAQFLTFRKCACNSTYSEWEENSQSRKGVILIILIKKKCRNFPEVGWNNPPTLHRYSP